MRRAAGVADMDSTLAPPAGSCAGEWAANGMSGKRMDTDCQRQNLQCQQRAASTCSVQLCSSASSNLTAMVLVSTASRRHRRHELASGCHSCTCNHVQRLIVITFRLNGCRVRVAGAVNGSAAAALSVLNKRTRLTTPHLVVATAVAPPCMQTAASSIRSKPCQP